MCIGLNENASFYRATFVRAKLLKLAKTLGSTAKCPPAGYAERPAGQIELNLLAVPNHVDGDILARLPFQGQLIELIHIEDPLARVGNDLVPWLQARLGRRRARQHAADADAGWPARSFEVIFIITMQITDCNDAVVRCSLPYTSRASMSATSMWAFARS